MIIRNFLLSFKVKKIDFFKMCGIIVCTHSNYNKEKIMAKLWEDRTFWEKVITILSFGLNLFWEKK